MKTFIENFYISSDVVYPDLISDKRQFKKVRKIDEKELKSLIGELKIANKYLVSFCGKFYYQHDFSTFECERV